MLNMLYLGTKLSYAMLYIAHWANKSGRCMQFAEIVTVALSDRYRTLLGTLRRLKVPLT